MKTKSTMVESKFLIHCRYMQLSKERVKEIGIRICMKI